MTKERIVVICPGRGTYTRESSGYLNSSSKASSDEIKWMDEQRIVNKLSSLTQLDLEPFKTKIHMSDINASPLIFACSLADYLSIDRNKYEVVAITGNSMGWYTSLALGQAINLKNAYQLINSMSSILKSQVGGQIIYPIVDKSWKINELKREKVLHKVKEAGAFISIYLGGYLVIAGKQESLDLLLKELPPIDEYPLQLPLHSAFHSPLLSEVRDKAFSLVHKSIFGKPQIPLIDGRGYVWSPFSSNISELYHYTLDHQVTEAYDFTAAIKVAIKEFCPDKLVLLGPGNTLGGSIAQILIQNNWLNIDSKKAFIERQNKIPYLISMGLNIQRNMISL